MIDRPTTVVREAALCAGAAALLASLGIDSDTSPAVASGNLAFKSLGRAIVQGTYQH